MLYKWTALQTIKVHQHLYILSTLFTGFINYYPWCGEASLYLQLGFFSSLNKITSALASWLCESLLIAFIFWESTEREGQKSRCPSPTHPPAMMPAWALCTAWCVTDRVARVRHLPNGPLKVWWKSWKRKKMSLTPSSQLLPPMEPIPASVWPSRGHLMEGCRWDYYLYDWIIDLIVAHCYC